MQSPSMMGPKLSESSRGSDMNERDDHVSDLPSIISSPHSNPRALGSFPSFASQPDVPTIVGFDRSIGGYGMAVYKHGRFGKPKRRLLMWDRKEPNQIFWCQDPSEFSSALRLSEIPPDARVINLEDIKEIRRGTEEDPDCPGYCGTSILRRSCHPSKFCLCISLLTSKRTIDLEFLNKDDFRKLAPSLVRYFKAKQRGEEDVEPSASEDNLDFSSVY